MTIQSLSILIMFGIKIGVFKAAEHFPGIRFLLKLLVFEISLINLYFWDFRGILLCRFSVSLWLRTGNISPSSDLI